MKTKRTPEQCAAERIFRSASLTKSGKYTYAWLDEEDRQCMCDGMRAVRLNDFVPAHTKPLNPDAFDLENIMGFAKKEDPTTWVEFPSAKELRKMIREDHKKQMEAGVSSKLLKKTIYRMNDYPFDVDAEFLLDMLILLPNAKVCWYRDHPSMLYFYDMEGKNDGVLLMVRRKAA